MLHFQIHFANTQKSSWIEDTLVQGFQDLNERLGGRVFQHLKVIFEAVNKRTHAGKDLFRVKVIGFSRDVGQIEIQKSATEPETALREVLDACRKVVKKRKFRQDRSFRDLAPIPALGTT